MNQETINYEDLKTINDNMIYLSNKLNTINNQSDSFQEQIDNVQTDVDNLKKEITDFIDEVKRNNRVSNAKQTIMLSQMEYDKKYSSRDEVRRRIIGILQSSDINIVKKNTMESIAEETIVNNPDYWLAPALVALCYWYTDKKDLAENALKKALKRSDEKTSLLFCLIHLRAGRINTAKKWLNRYLKNQDPTNMDCKIILLLDALSSGVFARELKEDTMYYIDFWTKQLQILNIYKYNQINEWNKFLSNIKNENNIESLPYVTEFVSEKDQITEKLNLNEFDEKAFEKLKTIINKSNNNENNYQQKIDKIVQTLIFDYEDEELNLKNEIKNNKSIIENNGTVLLNNNQSYIFNGNRTDFYSILTNICLGIGSEELSPNTKKLAMSLSKEFIIDSYKSLTANEKDNFPSLNIIIDDWIGTTTNGNNEQSLFSSLEESIDKKSKLQIPELINKELYISWSLGIITSIISLVCKIPILLIPIVLAEIIYTSYIIMKNQKSINTIKENLIEEKNEKKEILGNTLSEITDYYFKTLDSKNKYDEIVDYIEQLDSNDYIKVHTNDNSRNINIREK